MLVLSRLIGERIVIGHDIVITLVDIRNSEKARIGIEAPQEVPVHREEVYLAIQRERERGDGEGGESDGANDPG